MSIGVMAVTSGGLPFQGFGFSIQVAINVTPMKSKGFTESAKCKGDEYTSREPTVSFGVKAINKSL